MSTRTDIDPIALLRKELFHADGSRRISITQWAHANGMSVNYVAGALKPPGHKHYRAPGPKILDALGLVASVERVVTYRKRR